MVKRTGNAGVLVDPDPLPSDNSRCHDCTHLVKDEDQEDHYHVGKSGTHSVEDCSEDCDLNRHADSEVKNA
jgi:hypothetical protein